MAFLKQAAVAMGLALLTGCTGTVVNTAPIYQPVTGVIQMDITVPTGEPITKVKFLVDNTLHSEDDDGSDGFSAELDLSAFEPDSLVRIKAIGVRQDQTELELRENYLLVGAAEEEEAEAETETEATDAE